MKQLVCYKCGYEEEVDNGDEDPHMCKDCNIALEPERRSFSR